MKEAKNQWILPEKVNLTASFSSSANEHGLSTLVQQILWQRGIQTPESLERFLHADLQDLYDPYLLYDMQKAVERLNEAIMSGERILVYGDYDADGITSTTVIVETLVSLGADVDYYLPNRFKDGYGPNKNVYAEKIKEEISLILTVDNGVAGHEAIDYANSQGIDVIVTDHHELPEKLPAAYAIIHPKHPAGDYPFKELAGVGVAFKLACALLEEVPVELLELVAIGTIADMVSLTDENRILVKHGLAMMQQTTRIGLLALIQESKLNLQELDEQSIGFGIGPRLNALGRLTDPNPAVELLLTFDEEQAQTLAQEIDQWNQQRKQIVDDIVTQALEKLDEANQVHVILGENWHEGVLGIVAGKIMQKTGKPTIILTTKEEGLAKGSGRSVETFNLFESMSMVRPLFSKFGGHHSAVGLTIPIDHIAQLQAHLNQEVVRLQLDFAAGLPLNIDVKVPISAVSIDLINEINQLSPFGMDFPRPNFLIEVNQVINKRAIGVNNAHLKLQVADDQSNLLDVIGFGFGQYLDEITTSSLQIVGRLNINEWNGKQSPQFMLEDFVITDIQVFDYRAKKYFTQLNFEQPTLYVANFQRNIERFATIIEQPIYLAEDLLQMSELPSFEQLVFLDCPQESCIYQTIYQKAAVSRVYFVCYTQDDAYLDGLGSREQYAKLFQLIKQQKRLDVRYKLDMIATHLKIPKKLLIFMIQVFFELKFVTIDDGVLSYVDAPAKRDLTESPIYQKRNEKIKTEEFLLLSSLDVLKNWLNNS
ncbi:single-stranded-DNA-specific exonuclease RecJ [Enterococcus columbae]|uniref:Single-stranded-DNA-specific exonuclease RecJ n=1 Tax=Enterococcus columbae DSM 7374 = ATCC 51263 TaxID=1121865 RepID=S0KWI1_9ENTE|nr:single-stranded-DNA-specific exonuclease RecJ [Enterococcus columbae]EOT44468.1 single-stranded-DNA-specific exonuclease RecJ [Enterococcus columbae DSM 7374 = ATCC 51263]EOW84626.1 single-stranded-DNA-specific exonuclease RecJ [Enterococcus columbae DSM 7374 = ATCC 51263]OJG23513.1 single-stranded-DNA-specific exonuclease RecJ [Enterococcus columbae DSM 7374 = ATCC 51263]